MDRREEMFRTKFHSAATELGAAPDHIVSLKLRDNIGSYTEYGDLLRSLEREAGLHWREINSELQGRGYVITDDSTSVIIVEHETGLEILYIAGSIASLIGLVPLVLNSWYSIRGRFAGRHAPSDGGIEVRRLDTDGRLLEHHKHHPFQMLDLPVSAFHLALTSAAGAIDDELRLLKEQVRSLSARVEELESTHPPRAKTQNAVTATQSKRRARSAQQQ